MALTGILRPGHVQLRVMELGPALHHYKEMIGLIETGRDAEGRVYLKAWDEHDLFSIVLRESDRIRDDLLKAGIVLEDKPGGETLWRRA